MATPALSPRSAKPTTGLALWMERVLEECDRAGPELSPDAVHDLRVALRRCRSIADGIMAMDPHPEWKKMKECGKRLFISLGALRDVHVMQEWTRSLSPPEDQIGVALLISLGLQETELKADAAKAVWAFDRKQWKKWTLLLPRRAARLRKGSDLFQHLALERWTDAYELHRRALRNRSQVAFHSLRIGIKRFRYIVENFLPKQHITWAGDLKDLQDLLGDVHDLDVLWSAVKQLAIQGDDKGRLQWQQRIAGERGKRIASYREKMTGNRSLWQVWREALPVGNRIRASANQRLRLWASFFKPDFQHSHHVATFALQLLRGLPQSAQHPQLQDEKEILRVAAMVHEIGKARREKKYEKSTYDLLRRLKPPLGWSIQSWRMIAIVARFHRRAFPSGRHKTFQELNPEERKVAYRLIGILRLAEAFDINHDQSIGKLEVQERNEMILIKAEGYSPLKSLAEHIAAARHLLEVVYKRPILINTLASIRRTAA